jgi:uncharacterized RDD family membrane protein YckC
VPISIGMDRLAPASAGPATGPQFDNRRVLAALIDVALLVPVAVFMSILFGGFTDAAAALTLGWALYYYFALESDHGQTIGKRVMKLRVARADGGPLDPGRVAVRTILRPVDAIGAYLLGLIVMIATGQRRQRIGDLAAGTVVTDANGPGATATEEAGAAAPEAPVIEAPPMPAAPVVDTGRTQEDVPELKPFEPFAEPAPEPPPPPDPAAVPVVEPPQPALPEPPPALEADPVDEVEPPQASEDIVPVDRAEEPAAPTDEPVPVAEAEAEEEPEEPAPKPSGMEIVSSPIDLVMEDHDEEPEGDPPQEPAGQA